MAYFLDEIMKEVKKWKERMGVSFSEEKREWRLPGLLCADDLVLCDASEEDSNEMVDTLLKYAKEGFCR